MPKIGISDKRDDTFDDTVAEIMHAAKDEAAPAAELSEDSKSDEEEAPSEAASETDVQEEDENDGISHGFSLIVTFINHIQDR